MQVVFEKVEGGQLPTYAHGDDACMDLYARTDGIVESGGALLVPAGFKVAVPQGYGMFIYSRSGLAMNGIIVTNSPGVIDPGYRGEVKVQIKNNSCHSYAFYKGARVAQAAIKSTPHVTIVEGTLDDTERGENGFGSTGQ